MSWSQIPTFLRDKKGRVYLNPAKDYVQPFELKVDDPNDIVTIAANGFAGPFPLTARYDGPIEIFYVKVVVFDTSDDEVTNYDVRWLLEHPGKRIQFMPRSIPLIASAGDGGRPYVLSETIFIPAIQSLNVTYFNDDGAERKVELVLGGIKYYPNSAPEKIRQEMYSYIKRRERTYNYWQTTEEATVVGANLTDIPGFVRVPDDADLEIFKLTAQSTGTFRARIRDTANDRGLMSEKVHSSLLFGGHVINTPVGLGGSGGIFPARWATSWLVRRSVQFRIDFDDLSGAPNTINPIFGGRKIRYA